MTDCARAERGVDTLHVRELTRDDEAQWDAYVESRPDGTLFHTCGWKRAVESSLPYRPHYFLAESSGVIRGVLPLFWVKNPLVTGSLVSVPMAVYGGTCADDDAVAVELIDRARALARELGAGFVEYRHVAALAVDRLHPGGAYATFIKQLPSDPEQCLAGLPRKARAAARKAIRDFDLRHEVGRDSLDRFYHLFALNKRHLGSPIYPVRFFRKLLEEFPDTDILTVRSGGSDIAAVLSFYYKDTVIPYYSGGDSRFERMQSNNFMYMKLMEEGVRKGCKLFDFGRSRENTGAYDFKRNQGFEPTRLHYQFDLNTVAEPPNLSPDNPRFSLVKSIWKRMPLIAVRTLGPHLIRYFP